MKRLKIDYDEVQKAMEDTDRDAFEYFLDKATGEIIILSEDILNRARELLYEYVDEDIAQYEDVEFDEEPDIPEWIEDEIELAIDVFLDDNRYVRIPERSPQNGYNAMKEFVNLLNNSALKDELQQALDGKGAFRKFKDILEPYPKERKLWYGYNAKAVKKEIQEWLNSIGIEYDNS